MTLARINDAIPHTCRYILLPLYTLKQYMTMQVMNGFCLSLCRCEFARFLSKDKDETLSSNMSVIHF